MAVISVSSLSSPSSTSSASASKARCVWRPTRRRRPTRPVLVAELYQEREWSAAEVAANLDVSIQLVLRTLHDHCVPVRRGGPPSRAPSHTTIDPRLAALYADPEITTMLRRHHIPRRERPGNITERFPVAARVTKSFLREAHLEIGLAATHIE